MHRRQRRPLVVAILSLFALPAVAQQDVPIERITTARQLASDTRLLLRGDVGNDVERHAFALEFDDQGHFFADYSRHKLRDSSFDGRVLWGRDAAGRVHEVVSWERDLSLLMHGLITGNWTGAAAAWNISAGSESTSKTLHLDVEAPGRPFLAGVWVDTDTHDPTHVAFQTFGVPYELTFEGWKENELGRFPERVRYYANEMLVGTYRFDALERTEGRGFALENEVNEDVTLDATLPAELETRVIRSGHTFVRASVNGSDPSWFAFDTGASGTVLDSAFAERHGLTLVLGGVTATGAAGHASFRVWRGDELRIGRLVWRAPLLASTDLSRLERAFGVPLAGVLGADVLAHAVWSYDVTGGEIAMHLPGELDPPGAHWIDIRLSEGIPVVPAQFEDHNGWFILDTGGGGSGVTFNGPTTEKLGLLDGRRTTSSSVAGLGGTTSQRRGKLKTFVFGERTWRNLNADFPGNQGAWQDPYVDGLIGVSFLRPYRVIFDYPRARIGLLPR